MDGQLMDFHAAFFHNPIPMWIHDQGTLAFINANLRFLNEFGYDLSELLTMKPGDLFPADEIPPLFLDENLTQPPKPNSAHWRICHKNGRVIPVDLFWQPVQSGEQSRVLVAVIPQPEAHMERHILEARLRISEFSHLHSLDDILQKTLDEAEALTESSIGFFHFIEPDQKSLWLQTWSTNTLKNMCTAEGKLSHYALAQAGIWADSVREKKPVVYNDYTGLKRQGSLPEGHASLSRILTVPIMRRGMVVAIVGVGNKPVDYDGQDVKTVSLLADLAWDVAGAKHIETALQNSEYNYRSIMDQASDGIFIANPNGAYIDVNRAGCELLGYTREEILQRSIQSLMVYDASIPPRFEELRRGQTLLTERSMRRKDGSMVLVEISGKMLNDGRLLGIVRDITERKREEERIRYLALVMNKVSSAVISTDVDMHITHWNKAAETLYGWEENEVLGRPLDEVCQTEIQDADREEVRTILLARKKWHGELKQHHRNGRDVWVSASVTLIEDEHGNYSGGVTINHDITERKQAEEELRRTKETMEEINKTLQRAFEREQLASRTDSLTGMFNRRYFFELFDYEFVASRRYQRPLSVVMFDIDLFKRINDTFGHQVGDEVLKHTARVVHAQLRESDILSRYGGDEFVLLLPNSDEQEALTVVRRIHRKVRTSKFIFDEKTRIDVTISVGVASWQLGMEQPAQLLRQADDALYAAKQAGRDRIVLFNARDIHS